MKAKNLHESLPAPACSLAGLLSDIGLRDQARGSITAGGGRMVSDGALMLTNDFAALLTADDGRILIKCA
jgi:hypothetical protein